MKGFEEFNFESCLRIMSMWFAEEWEGSKGREVLYSLLPWEREVACQANWKGVFEWALWKPESFVKEVGEVTYCGGVKVLSPVNIDVSSSRDGGQKV